MVFGSSGEVTVTSCGVLFCLPRTTKRVLLAFFTAPLLINLRERERREKVKQNRNN